jgi:hypothetical protein
MRMVRGGEDIELKNKNEILSIKSPSGKDVDGDLVGAWLWGPYKVVHIDEDERWAMVVFEWNSDAKNPEPLPRLGLRWFWKKTGYPVGRDGVPLWMVLPNSISLAFLDKKEAHGLSDERVDILKKFLNGEIKRDDLEKYWGEG